MTDADHHEPEYDEVHMRFLELVWGDGFLSPGGSAEVDLVLDGVEVAGKRVLDLGCGSGGVTIYIAEKYGPAFITGFDVEQPAIDRAKAKAAELPVEVAAHIGFVRGDPGPLPFADASFDVVFSKDAMVHVADKESLFADIFRVLAPGGVIAASDWLIGHDGEPSAAMKDYLQAEGLSFGMASAGRYAKAMEKAGFTDVRTTSRNQWYRQEAARERAALQGELYEKAIDLVGRAFVDKNIATWAAMQKVLDTGEHCPTHLRGAKP